MANTSQEPTSAARPARSTTWPSPPPYFDDEPLSDADPAAINRAFAEPGMVFTADTLAELIAGLDDEVLEFFVAGRVADAIDLVRFNAFEQQHPFAQRDQIARQRGA